MSATTTFSSPPGPHEEALAQYKTISLAALIALGLGILSALVLVTPLLSVLPLAAIAVALISLRRIRTSEGQLTGRLPAVAGLCLATFFLSWSLSQRFGREIILEGHARQFAQAWLTLVAVGDFQQADQMRMSAHSRLLTTAGRREFYEKNPESVKALNDFFKASPLKEFIAAGPEVKFHLESGAGSARTANSDMIVLKYVFQDSHGSSVPIWITVKREFHPDEQHSEWQIEKVTGQEQLEP